MIQKMLTSKVKVENWLLFIRVIGGLLIFVHGLGIFNPGHMQGNIAWLTDIHFPAPSFMAYLGKGTELAGGVLLIVGLATRIAGALLVINMAVITFILGSGNIFDAEELPFLLLVVFLFLAITGAGNYSLDNWLFNREKRN